MLKKGDVISAETGFSTVSSNSEEKRLIIIDVMGDFILGVWITSDMEEDAIPLPEDAFSGRPFHAPVFVNVKRLSQIPLKACRYMGAIEKAYFDKILRKIILCFTENYYQIFHAEKTFLPGKSYIPYAGRVYNQKEMGNLVDAALDFWLTEGRYAKQFADEFAKWIGAAYCILTNSGSSANLLALSALTSPKLGERRLKPGDEVIATACAFPTTVNPIIQNNLIPVFLDVEMGTYNIQAEQIEKAISEKTKAVFLAHTLGNPFDIEKVLKIVQKYDLWLIEDACDALGTTYKEKQVGTFGDIATFSFYAAHQITMGEGGALVTNNLQLKRLIESFRDWGRDCWCATGHDNTCGKRFGWQLGTLPEGYDHKYIYAHIGYNLKITDLQAAIGIEQLKKLPLFIAARNKNWSGLYEAFQKYQNYFVLPKPTSHAQPCWFGFPLTVKREAPFSRDQIVAFLEKNQIATRSLFAGNIMRHPAFAEVRYRVHGGLEQTDTIMQDTFWIGIYPGISTEMLDFMIAKVEEYVKAFR